MPWEEEIARCRECPPEDVAAARAPFLYAGPAREALLRLKFGGWRAVAEAVGASMAAVTPVAPDLVTWVPLSPARRAQRGYDQSRSLATVVARELGVPARPLLRRTVDTLPQSSRTGEERRRAMRGAFRAAAGAASNAAGTVLLVDDVLTTGATAAECARVLHDAGAREVALLTAARATSRALPARCYHREGLPSESVVARETFPVVDASRRRSDPRKGTVGS
jgi:ComF family protein